MTGIRINLVGKEFDRLVILSLEEQVKNGNHKYLCKCSCGNEVVAQRSNLVSGRTQSCGCLYKESRFRKREKFSVEKSEKRAMLNYAKRKIKTHDIPNIKKMYLIDNIKVSDIASKYSVDKSVIHKIIREGTISSKAMKLDYDLQIGQVTNSNEFRKIRKILKIKQKEIAEHLDLSRSTISQWELGIIPISMTYEKEIVNFFRKKQEQMNV